jgi:hypothetical protein
MISPIISRRKWKLYAHDRHIVIVKGSQERLSHPLMKAFLWALYLPEYPNITVEIRVGDKYKPDVVAFDGAPGSREGRPVFWGEAGQVGVEKIRSLLRRYRETHFAIAKWDMRLNPLEQIVTGACDGLERLAPVDLLGFPPDSAERFIDEQGTIQITFADLNWIRLR